MKNFFNRAFLLIQLLISSSSVAQELDTSPIGREYTVKSAIIYHLLNYVEWPNPSSIHKICILGKDNFGKYSDWINKKGNSVSLIKLPDEKGSENCQIAYIDTDLYHLKKTLSYLQNRPVFTVSDNTDFINLGGMLMIKIVDGRSQLQINLKAISEAQLIATPPLIQLSDRVIK